MSNTEQFGAYIERGEITEKVGNGYIVRSYTRFDILTQKIYSINDNAYSVGDMVYYFMFPDGNGMIISAIPPMQ